VSSSLINFVGASGNIYLSDRIMLKKVEYNIFKKTFYLTSLVAGNITNPCTLPDFCDCGSRKEGERAPTLSADRDQKVCDRAIVLGPGIRVRVRLFATALHFSGISLAGQPVHSETRDW